MVLYHHGAAIQPCVTKLSIKPRDGTINRLMVAQDDSIPVHQLVD